MKRRSAIAIAVPDSQRRRFVHGLAPGGVVAKPGDPAKISRVIEISV